MTIHPSVSASVSAWVASLPPGTEFTASVCRTAIGGAPNRVREALYRLSLQGVIAAVGEMRPPAKVLARGERVWRRV